MPRDDPPFDQASFDHLPRRSRPTRGTRQPRRARQSAARKIVLRTAWLEAPLVYWTGRAPEPVPSIGDYHPVTGLIAARLAGLAPGIYTLPLYYDGLAPGFEPRLPEAIPVTLALLTDAVRAWTQAKDYPRALPPLVGELKSWRATVEARFQSASAALRAAENLGQDHPDVLGLEAFCLWIGPDAARPSRQLTAAAIADGLRAPPTPVTAQSETIRQLAALILGQRRAEPAIPRDLAAWAACGRTCPAWPADRLLAAARRCAGGPGGLARAAGSIPSTPAASLAAVEAGLAAPETDPAPMLASLGGLVGAVDTTARESRRQLDVLAGAIDTAYRRLYPAVLEIGPSGALRFHRRWREALGSALGTVDADLRRAKGQWVVEKPRTAVARLADLTEWVTGIRVSSVYAELWLRRFARSPSPSLGAFWVEQIQAARGSIDLDAATDLDGATALDATPLDATAWQQALCGLAGRWAAFGSAGQIAQSLSDWIAVCQAGLLPGRDAGGILGLAVDCFGEALGQTGRTEADTDRLLGLLDRHAVELVPDILAHLAADHGHRGWNINPTPEAISPNLRRRMALLGRLAALGVEGCGAAFRLALGRMLVMGVGVYPEVIPIFLERLASAPLLQRPGKPEAEVWCAGWPWMRVWSLGNTGLAEALWEWSRELIFDGDLEPWPVNGIFDQILDFCSGTEDVFLWTREHAAPPGFWPDQVSRQAFLVQHFELLRRVTDDARRASALGKAMGADSSDLVRVFRDRFAILALAYDWAREGHREAETLALTLLDELRNRTEQAARLAQAARDAGRSVDMAFPTAGLATTDSRLAMALACGDPRRVPPLLQAIDSRAVMMQRQFPENPIDGWEFLGRFPGAQMRLAGIARRGELILRVIHLLERIALTTRLPSRREYATSLARWDAPPVPGDLVLPRGCPPGLAGDLALLAAYRMLAGQAKPYGPDIQRLIDRPRAVPREIEALEARHAAGDLSASAASRLAKLRGYRESPATLDVMVIGSLAGQVPKQVDLAALLVLEQMVDEVLQAHWRPVLDQVPPRTEARARDWDNALRLYYRIETNRPQLRQLLREVAGGEGFLDLLGFGANRDFARRLAAAGVDVDAWLAPFEQTYTVHGDRWRAYVATDPLEVLQMGNLFGTCLSVDQFNAFSTVANAVEINKRVLYVRNSQGHVIGRKLIAMSRAGRVFGFHTYDSSESQHGERGYSPWIKIRLDQCCLALAERAGARLAQPEDQMLPGDEVESLAVFTNWYDDGAEAWDPWIFGPAAALAGELDPAGQWLERIDQGSEEDYALRRLLVFLGDAVLPALQKVAPAVGARSEALAWVARHTEGRAVRALVRGWGEVAGGDQAEQGADIDRPIPRHATMSADARAGRHAREPRRPAAF
jgi:hypothetical protein